MRMKLLLAAAAVVVSSAAVAADMKPAVIYDMGGKFDKSFIVSFSDEPSKFKLGL